MDDNRRESIRDILAIGAATVVGLALVGFPVIAGVGILVWQVFSFLQNGVWQPLSLVDALTRLDVRWAIYPAEWIGLHSIMDVVPTSAALIGFGVLMTVVLIASDS